MGASELIPFVARSDRFCYSRSAEIPSWGFLLVSPCWGFTLIVCLQGIQFSPVGGLLLFSFLGELHEVVQDRLREDNVKFKGSNKTAEHPFSSQLYRPEIDVTEECDEEQVQFYQSLVGIMKRLCEIGRINILTETSLFSTYLSCPRVGHLH